MKTESYTTDITPGGMTAVDAQFQNQGTFNALFTTQANSYNKEGTFISLIFVKINFDQNGSPTIAYSDQVGMASISTNIFSAKILFEASATFPRSIFARTLGKKSLYLYDPEDPSNSETSTVAQQNYMVKYPLYAVINDP